MIKRLIAIALLLLTGTGMLFAQDRISADSILIDSIPSDSIFADSVGKQISLIIDSVKPIKKVPKD